MIISNKDELDLFKKKIPNEFINNPAFFKEFQNIEYNFNQLAPVEVNLNNNNISFIFKKEIEKDLRINEANMSIINFSIYDNNFEVSKLTGQMLDAKQYNKVNNLDNNNISSFLNLSYNKKIYDINGIEISNGIFNNKIDIKGNNFLDDTNILKDEIIKNYPTNWHFNSIPNFININDAIIEINYRCPDNSMLIKSIKNEYKNSNLISNDSYLSYVKCDFPEILATDNDGKFIKFDKDNNCWILNNQFNNQNLEDIIKNKNKNVYDVLKFRFENAKNDSLKNQYEILFNNFNDYINNYDSSKRI